MSNTVFKVPSQSIQDKEYIVRKTPVGLRCNCPKFVFDDKEPCKHIKAIQEKYKV